MNFLSRAARKPYFVLFSLLFLGLFRLTIASNLIIVEVQIEGEKPYQDFIKIFNPSSEELNVAGYKLKKRTSTGNESSIRVFPAGSKIKPGGFFIWANAEKKFYLEIGANVWSMATLSKNNSVALLDKDGKIIDAIAWGKSENPFAEGKPFLENPGKNQQLKRKIKGFFYQDTNNNSEDFYLSSSGDLAAPLEKTSNIDIFFQKEVPINKEIDVKIMISGLKSAKYDLKVAIDKNNKILSEIFNPIENRWLSSNYYLRNFFEGNSFEGILKLRIKEDFLDFRGGAVLFVRIRENGKSSYLEKKETINFIEPEIEKPKNIPLEAKINFEKLNRNSFSGFFYTFILALILSVVLSLIGIVFLKKIGLFKIK